MRHACKEYIRFFLSLRNWESKDEYSNSYEVIIHEKKNFLRNLLVGTLRQKAPK